MAHVVTTPTPPFRIHGGALEVHQIPAAQDNLVWLLVDLRSNAAAVVDGPDASGALEHAKRLGVTITHVLNTHTHFDHVGLNHDLDKRGLLSAMQVLGPAKVADQVPGLTRGVDEGDTITFAGANARVMRTEGHIEGHICFVFDEVLFSGDTLFTGGCGRVFTGDYVAMQDGLSRLAALDGALRVCCAHEYTEDNLKFARSIEPNNQQLAQRASEVTSLRARGGCAVPSLLSLEKATNPMLRWHSEELLASLRAQSPGADLSSEAAVFTATRKLKDAGHYRR